jgi:hypothetical protein
MRIGALSVALSHLGAMLWRNGEEQQSISALDESLGVAVDGAAGVHL